MAAALASLARLAVINAAPRPTIDHAEQVIGVISAWLRKLWGWPRDPAGVCILAGGGHLMVTMIMASRSAARATNRGDGVAERRGRLTSERDWVWAVDR